MSCTAMHAPPRTTMTKRINEAAEYAVSMIDDISILKISLKKYNLKLLWECVATAALHSSALQRNDGY